VGEGGNECNGKRLQLNEQQPGTAQLRSNCCSATPRRAKEDGRMEAARDRHMKAVSCLCGKRKEEQIQKTATTWQPPGDGRVLLFPRTRIAPVMCPGVGAKTRQAKTNRIDGLRWPCRHGPSAGSSSQRGEGHDDGLDLCYLTLERACSRLRAQIMPDPWPGALLEQFLASAFRRSLLRR